MHGEPLYAGAMQPDESPQVAAATVAGLVPRLLQVHMEPAGVDCELALAAAVDRIAEHLLRWHDVLVGLEVSGPVTAPPPWDACSTASAPDDLKRSVHRAHLPGSAPGLEVASRELSHIARAARPTLRIGDSPARSLGEQIVLAVEDLAQALERHAALIRELATTLERPVSEGASETEEVRRAQVLSRLTRAERALERRAVATLPG